MAYYLPWLANTAGGASLTVTWDAVTGADSYKVYYGTETMLYDQEWGSGTDVGNVTTYAITGLFAATTYYCAVTTVDGGVESDFGNEMVGVAA